MSIRVMTQVWDSGQYNGSKLLLLLALADFAHDDGANVYPSVDTLAQKTRCDRRTVQRNLRQLEGEGAILLVRPATRHGPAEYQLGAAFCRPSEGQGRHPVPLGAASDPNQGRRDAAQTVSKEPPKESINARERAHERERVVREEFDNWYQHYPRKVSRGAAEDPFGKARVDGGVSLEILIEATKHYAAEMAGKDSQYIKHPATWLNGKCWLDEPGPLSQTGLTWWQKREIDESARGERYGEEVDLGNNGRQ